MKEGRRDWPAKRRFFLSGETGIRQKKKINEICSFYARMHVRVRSTTRRQYHTQVSGPTFRTATGRRGAACIKTATKHDIVQYKSVYFYRHSLVYIYVSKGHVCFISQRSQTILFVSRCREASNLKSLPPPPSLILLHLSFGARSN